ncbi:MAG: hypothetical protein ACQCXQ_14710, partial [Verrucomicrobiales bacterium]
MMLGGVNEAGSSQAVREDADAGTVEVSHAGAWAASGGFDGGNSAECQLRIDPMSGSGELVIGSTVLPFELATAPGALRFWGYQVESETVRASRPRWQVGTIGSGAFQAMEGGGVFDMFYQIPFSVGQSITPQYSTTKKETNTPIRSFNMAQDLKRDAARGIVWRFIGNG